jgi:hypothetical protein
MRALVWGVAAVGLLAGAAIAQDDSDIPWAAVKLDDGISVDVPAIVAAQVKPAKGAPADVKMYFNLSAGAPGTLSCELRQDAYSKDSPRETLLKNLTKEQAGNFCRVDRPGVSQWQLGSAFAGKTDGLPSANCLSAFSDASQQIPGRVLNLDVVAGQKNYYQLVCINAFDDKDGAVTAYATRWGAMITRIQKSLRVAADEK